MIINQNRIIELDSIDSTNSFAERLIKEKEVQEGIIIWAHEQTAGKGQGENVWLSEPGKNLTLSMILYPRFLPVDRQFLLNKAISLGVIDFVHTLLPPESVKIKWPNDICQNYSKLGGILISNIITGNYFSTSSPECAG
jgi:BirA family biotin operon repressor/biotin-[acetyl-CoA-carboxylase] ligase